MDYKKTKAPHNTITRDMVKLDEKVGNVYESVVIISKRSNAIAQDLKKELNAKLQDYASPSNDNVEEVSENKEQIEICRSYELMPKPTLIATQEFLEDQLVYDDGKSIGEED